MKRNKLQYIILPLFVAISMLMSCHEDRFVIDMGAEESNNGSSPDVTENGDALTVTVTLDNMGGRGDDDGEYDPYAKMENYIDAEKIRVLVFDEEDYFLFESKNRFIKQLDPAEDHSVWSVTIPLSSYGNDKDYDWDWDKIREKLTTKSFKIAILANRPDREWNFGILKKDADGNDIAGDYQVPNGWFGSIGPQWTKKNSVVYSESDKDWKKVFDLHHCQPDNIYRGKNYYTTVNVEKDANGKVTNNANNYAGRNYNFYGCIAFDEQLGDNPYMGATSSWLDWGPNNNDTNNRDPNQWDYRKNILPSESHPIPMYGIQKFAAIKNWKKGATYSLDRDDEDYKDKAISMLRSVVKLELFLPKDVADGVLLFYSNIYARCEPMDVWTPTDQIWNRNGIDHSVNNSYDNCEVDLLKSIGLMTYANDPYPSKAAEVREGDHIKPSKLTYQKRLAKLYAVWKEEQEWSFDKYNADGYLNITDKIDNSAEYKNYLDSLKNAKADFIRVFNPCIQRNNVVYINKCNKDKCSCRESSYDHYVVYTGERNINDPSNLGQLGNKGGGNPTVLYWCLTKGTGTNLKTYSFPIIDYGKRTLANDKVFYKGSGKTDNNIPNRPANGSTDGTNMGTYLIALQTFGTAGATISNKNDWPLPLIRNHVYRITLTGSAPAKTRTGESDMNFSVQFEEMHTKDIGFK